MAAVPVYVPLRADWPHDQSASRIPKLKPSREGSLQRHALQIKPLSGSLFVYKLIDRDAVVSMFCFLFL